MEIPLTTGIGGASPMPGGGGFTMEHGAHSAPIGVLDPFSDNVSPSERASSQDWSAEKPLATEGIPLGGNDNDDAREASELPNPGESSGVGGGDGIARLSNPIYGSPGAKPYQV